MDAKELNSVAQLHNRLKDNLEKVIIGKGAVLDKVILALLCGGHLLIEDVPGTGKTVLAKSMAISLDARFSRIQFTPDMLPADVTGVSIYNQKTTQFEFRPGPIVANIVLADEINRATPKTQSALLEAMEEKQVTVDGSTHNLPEIFMVMATQNPIEYEGTFNLPEAQMDRFMLRIRIGYPQPKAEVQMMNAQQFTHPLQSLQPVATLEEVNAAREAVKKVYLASEIEDYIVRIVNATRDNDEVYLGASPRASLALYRLAQCRAAFEERDFVIPDDIKSIASDVLAHRLLLQPSASLNSGQTREFLADLLQQIDTPA
ncbi:MAG: MoxR-like ATPase [Chloroflexota bacterium]|nr:MoxR-like ATPase [Chloroflexota bacterium]